MAEDPSRDAQEDTVEILRAMLTVAEDDLRAKDSQIEYIQQMLSANEQALKSREGRVAELVQENRELQHEIAAFNELFNKYIAKAEARVQSNPGLAQVRASKVAAAAKEGADAQSASAIASRLKRAPDSDAAAESPDSRQAS